MEVTFLTMFLFLATMVAVLAIIAGVMLFIVLTMPDRTKPDRRIER